MLETTDTDPEKVLDALGNPVRREILRMLARQPQPVGELAAQLPVSRPAVSKHLRILENAHLVSFDRAGTRNVFRIDTAGFATVRQWLDAFWDEALPRFAAVAEAMAAAEQREDNP